MKKRKKSPLDTVVEEASEVPVRAKSPKLVISIMDRRSVGKVEQTKRKGPALHSLFTNPMKKKARRAAEGKEDSAHNTEELPLYDPSSEIPMEDVDILVKFMEEWASKPECEVNLDILHVRLDFFYKLFDMDGWLSDEHLEVSLYLMRKKWFENPKLYCKTWTTTDMWFQRYLEKVEDVLPSPEELGQEKEKPPKFAKIFDYVNRRYPKFYGRLWSGVSKVYMPYSLGKDHWVLAELDLQ